MAQTVKILNWNIQNFGETKCGIKYGNEDVVEAIAETVVAENVDIFVMLELNTTKQATAKAVAECMRKELKWRAPGFNDFQTCVLSPNTGLEFYAFFIRDTTVTTPMPITAIKNAAKVPKILGTGYGGLTDATFTAKTGNKVLSEFFPLIAPDLPMVSQKKRKLGTPDWPATRFPVLGLFWVPGATAANRLLPIVACHFAPNATLAEQQFKTLRYFSLLAELGPAGTAPVALNVDSGGGAAAHTTNSYVLLGDFNVDYNNNSAAYAAIVGANPQLNATAWVNDNTHLVTYKDYSPRDQKTPASLAINNFDRFFTRITGGAGAAANPICYPIPDRVSRRKLTLNASVDHYAELDQRGFQGGNYKDIVTDFAQQLTGDSSHIINVRGALVGTRLISDHLPVTLDVTLN